MYQKCYVIYGTVGYSLKMLCSIVSGTLARSLPREIDRASQSKKAIKDGTKKVSRPGMSRKAPNNRRNSHQYLGTLSPHLRHISS